MASPAGRKRFHDGRPLKWPPHAIRIAARMISQSPKDISVVVPVFNGENHIADCLNSLVRQETPPREIIVVNDGSRDGTAQRIREISARASVPILSVDLDENQGAAVARFAGAKKGKGEILAFIDADCIAPKDWLTKIRQAYQEDSTLGGVGGRYDHGDEPSLIGHRDYP